MTIEEKNKILFKKFDDIWGDLWLNHNSKIFKNEYNNAKCNYEKNYNLIKKLIKESENVYKYTECGFPKGRKNLYEKDFECAEREFIEETGYTKNDYEYLSNCKPIIEEFLGSNGIYYKHIYYIVKIKRSSQIPIINMNNIHQAGEVKNIGWFSFNECMSLIRTYDKAKKFVLENVYNLILQRNDILDFY